MFAALTAAWAARKWLPFALAGLGGFLLAALLIGVPAYYMVSGARDSRDAAITRADMASQDAQRWHQAAEERRAAIERQNAEIEAARADALQSEAILETADMLARAEAADLMAEISKWKARANANPDQTCTLGPLDRDAVRVLVGP